MVKDEAYLKVEKKIEVVRLLVVGILLKDYYVLIMKGGEYGG